MSCSTGSVKKNPAISNSAWAKKGNGTSRNCIRVTYSLSYVQNVLFLPTEFLKCWLFTSYKAHQIFVSIKSPNPCFIQITKPCYLHKHNSSIYSQGRVVQNSFFYGIWRRVNGTGIPTFWRNSSFILKSIEVGQNEDTLFLQNFGNRLSSDVLYPRQTKSSAMLYKCVCVCEKFEYKPTKHWNTGLQNITRD